MAVNPIPEGYHSVTPALSIDGAAEAIEFYKRAFGAEERYRMPTPDGRSPTPSCRSATRS
jgi:PhnB protein